MRFLMGLTLTMFFCFTAKAQMAEPVKWSFEATKINETEFEITLTASIEEGWYVYSQELSNKGPVPTQINFDKNPNIVLDGKPYEIGVKKEIFDENFNMTVAKLSDKTKYSQCIKLLGKTPSIKGKLTYMTCNGEMCLPPKNVEFNIDLNQLKTK
jgi:thiol:disulfide interchange protein